MSGYTCPQCQSASVANGEIPDCQLTYRDGDENFRQDLPPLHDCKCLNCGAEWLVLVETLA